MKYFFLIYFFVYSLFVYSYLEDLNFTYKSEVKLYVSDFKDSTLYGYGIENIDLIYGMLQSNDYILNFIRNNHLQNKLIAIKGVKVTSEGESIVYNQNLYDVDNKKWVGLYSSATSEKIDSIALKNFKSMIKVEKENHQIKIAFKFSSPKYASSILTDFINQFISYYKLKLIESRKKVNSNLENIKFKKIDSEVKKQLSRSQSNFALLKHELLTIIEIVDYPTSPVESEELSVKYMIICFITFFLISILLFKFIASDLSNRWNIKIE